MSIALGLAAAFLAWVQTFHMQGQVEAFAVQVRDFAGDHQWMLLAAGVLLAVAWYVRRNLLAPY